MHRFTLILMLLVSTAVCGTNLLADEPQGADTLGVTQLKPAFSDDFSTDTRGDYEIEGDVNWEPGKLTLQPDALITRKVDGGAWAKVELAFTPPETPAENQPPAVLDVWFVLDGATPCFLRIMIPNDPKDDDSATLSLLDTMDRDGKRVAILIRETRLAVKDLDSLTIEYRHGLVRASTANKLLLAGYIQNGAANVTASLIVSLSSQAITHFNSLCNEPFPQLSPDQQLRLAEAVTQNQAIVVHYQQGRFSEAAKLGEQVLEIRKVVLGKEHPSYATSLNNLAGLYESMGDTARAELLYLEA